MLQIYHPQTCYACSNTNNSTLCVLLYIINKFHSFFFCEERTLHVATLSFMNICNPVIWKIIFVKNRKIRIGFYIHISDIISRNYINSCLILNNQCDYDSHNLHARCTQSHSMSNIGVQCLAMWHNVHASPCGIWDYASREKLKTKLVPVELYNMQNIVTSLEDEHT